MSDSINYYVDKNGPTAVYQQIENQVRFAISSGAIGKGDALPSVRDMSLALDVNPNTVTKAYRDLELMGFVYMRRGVGVIVAEKAMKLAKNRTRKMVRAHLRDAVGECSAMGLSPSEIESIVSEAIVSSYRPYSDPSDPNP